jgi:hypothetical protein
MKSRMDEPLHRERAQGMAEFALILPLLLVVVFGVIEMGRLLFIYSAVMTSSREAVRFGSSVGTNVALPNFRDCSGIRASALRLSSLAGVQPENIQIGYDHGPGVGASVALPSTCENAFDSGLFTLGDRVVVTVTATFNPIVPLLNIPSFPITSHSARTIVREVPLSPPPPLVTQTHLVEFDYFNFPNETVINEPDTGSVTAAVGIYYSGDPLAVPVTVPIFFAGDAEYEVDYSPTFLGSVTIPANSNTALVRVDILGDLIDEFDEKILLYLRTPKPADVALGVVISHTITIVDNDPIPDVGFALASSSGLEGTGSVNSSAIAVSLYLPGTTTPIVSGKPVTVTFSVTGGTASANDFTIFGAEKSGTTYTLIIPPGQQAGMIYLNPDPDSIYEGNETVTLSLSSAVNANRLTARSNHTFTIINDDEPPVVSFVWPGQLVKEGTTATAMLMLDRVSGIDTTINVSYLMGPGVVFNRDRCHPNKDYDFAMDNPEFPGGNITIPAGSLYSSPSTLITACNDVLVNEPDEIVTVKINSATNALVGGQSSHVFTITESNPTPPSLSFAVPTQSVLESAGIVPVIAQLSGPSGQIIQFSYTIEGTATYTGGSPDFTLSPVPGVVTIPAGAGQGVIDVGVIDDPIDEMDETILFTMANPVNATLGSLTQHLFTILNDDTPRVDFAQVSQSIPEDADVVEVVVRLSSPARQNVTVPFAVTGTASAGWENDYMVLADSIVIPTGTLAFTIPIYINNDGFSEDTETIILTLGTPDYALLGPNMTHTIYIQDNDAGCSVSNGSLQYLLFGSGSEALLRRLSWPLTNEGEVPFALYSLKVSWPLERTGPFLDEVYVNYSGTTSTPIWTLNLETSPAYMYGPWFGPADGYLYQPGSTKTVDVIFTNSINSGPYLFTSVFLNQETFQTCSISIFDVYTP